MQGESVYKGTVGRSVCSDSFVMVFTGDTGKTRRSEGEAMQEHQCTWVVDSFFILISRNYLHSHGWGQQRTGEFVINWEGNKVMGY